MLMVSMNLSFPQKFSSFLPSAGLSGSSWLLHPKIQLEFCCEISSVISSSQLRKAKHNRSGVWHKHWWCLLKGGAVSQNFSCSQHQSPSILSKVNPWWEGIFCCISTWFPHSCWQDPHLPLPVAAGRSP